jgi:predicted signal transduction protein with EAL and GGDEF domain
MIIKYTCIRCHRKIKENAPHCDKIERALCKKCTIESLTQWDRDIREAMNTPSAALAASFKRASELKAISRRKAIRNHNSAFPISLSERIFPRAMAVCQRLIGEN